jgi:coenzyme PQQ synthesis protein D (PqqD)
MTSIDATAVGRRNEDAVEGREVGRESAFVLQPQDVVLESFADETVAVHLGTGRYFSIDLIGAEVIELLGTGAPLGAIVDRLARRYRADATLVDDTVTQFVGRLLDEGLIQPAPGAATTTLPEPERASAEFRPPTISVYSDMEDLLLLDPIHDVDETGWPVRAEPAAGDASAPVDSE